MAEHDYALHYEKWHDGSPEHIAVMKSFYKKILAKHFPNNKNAKIVDFGCGMGFALLALKDLGYENIEGIEIDESQASASRKNGLEVTLTSDALGYFTRMENTLDMVIAIDVIEHIPPGFQQDVLKSIYKAIKPGGTFICTVPNANSTLAGRWRYIDWTHKTSFTEHSLEYLLSNSGFKNVTVEEVDIYKKYDKKPSFIKLAAEGILKKMMRSWRRLEIISELGIDEGRVIPISVNILGKGKK